MATNKLFEAAAEILAAGKGKNAMPPQKLEGEVQVAGGPTPENAKPDDDSHKMTFAAKSASAPATKPSAASAKTEEVETEEEVLEEDQELLDEAVDMSDAKSVATHLAKKAISLHGISNPNRAAHHAKNASAIEATIDRVKRSSSPSELAKAHTEVGSVSAARRRMNVGRAMSSAEKSAHKSLQSGVVKHLQQHLDQHHAAFRNAAAKFAAKNEEYEQVDEKMEWKNKMKEDVDALFSDDETISEEFKIKVSTIFEARVQDRVTQLEEQIEAQYASMLEEAVESVKQELTEKINDYVGYIVEEWMEENQIAIEKGIRAELTEDFINGLRNLFAEHYIDVPAEKVDLVDELATKVDELEAKLDEEVERSVEYRTALIEAYKEVVTHEVCEGLVATQVAKIKELAESVGFSTEEEYRQKLEIIRENYFPSGVKKADAAQLNEQVDSDEKVDVTDPIMKSIVQSISKTTRI